jgi:hypothetical protein
MHVSVLSIFFATRSRFREFVPFCCYALDIIVHWILGYHGVYIGSTFSVACKCLV